MVQKLNSKSKILVIGATVIDLLVHVDNLPQTGEDVYGELENTLVGGCAYNVQQVIDQFGLNNDLLTPVGAGPYAQMVKRKFAEQQIPILIEDENQDNGWNISFVEHDGERTFLSIPGIEINWQDKWFEHIDVAAYEYIYIAGYELEGPSGEVIVRQIIEHKSSEAKIIFDPSPRANFINKEILDEIMKAGTIIHCNKSELFSMAPAASVEEAAMTLFKITEEPVVITLGDKGTAYYDGSNFGYVPAEKVEVVDTIGAGDSHTGAFISGLASGLTIQEACQLGSKVAAKIVQQSGGTFSDTD